MWRNSVKCLFVGSLMLSGVSSFAGEMQVEDKGMHVGATVKGGYRWSTLTPPKVEGKKSESSNANSYESKVVGEVQLGTLPLAANLGFGFNSFALSDDKNAVLNKKDLDSARVMYGDIGLTAWVPAQVLPLNGRVIPFVSATFAPNFLSSFSVTSNAQKIGAMNIPSKTFKGTSQGFSVNAGTKIALADVGPTKLSATAEYSYSRAEMILDAQKEADKNAEGATLSGHGLLVGFNAQL
jgi:hypothetical protein